MIFKVYFPKNLDSGFEDHTITIQTIDDFKKAIFMFEYKIDNFQWDERYESYFRVWEAGYNWQLLETYLKTANNINDSKYIKLHQKAKMYYLVDDIEPDDIKKGMISIDFPYIRPYYMNEMVQSYL